MRAIDFKAARTIVELGAGTGAITSEVLRRMNSKCTLYALDINPRFVEHIEAKTVDRRLVPIVATAENLTAVLAGLGVRCTDAIISSLGLTNMTDPQRCSIIGQATRCLSQGGVLTQYQYRPANTLHWLLGRGSRNFSEKEFLQQFFHHVTCEQVMWNLPPATVFTCRFGMAPSVAWRSCK